MTTSTNTLNKGFTLIELLSTIAILTIVSGIGYAVVSNYQSGADEQKLKTHVASLNSALKIYLLNGGDLTGANTAEDVLTRLKTIADDDSQKQIVGVRGSMIDQRLAPVYQSGNEITSAAPRAIWDATQKEFVLKYTPVMGIKEFSLDGVPSGTPAKEARSTSLAYAEESSWVWDYTDFSNSRKSAPIPVNTAPTTLSPVVAGSGPGKLALAEPTFSVPAGTSPITNFPMMVDISDPNAAGTSRLFYSLDGNNWEIYTSPLEVTPEMEIAAVAIAMDPDRYSDSNSNAALYGASPVSLLPPLLESDTSIIDFRSADTATISITNPNDPTVSKAQYRVNQGDWQDYTAEISLHGDDWLDGIRVESRIAPTAEYYTMSASTDVLISVSFSPIPLEAPLIDFSHRRFDKDHDNINVTILDPNTSGASEVLYKIIPASEGIETNYMLYTGAFNVKYDEYPDGFAVKAYASSTSPRYINSQYAKRSTGSYFGDDVDTGTGMKGRFYDLKQFVDGTATNIDDHTHNWKNEVFYDYLRQMTPYEGNGEYGFNASVLDAFYSPDKELYASQFATPFLDAEDGPSAFGLGNEIDPGNWLAHYTTYIRPEVPGYYRFSGRGDDVLQVWIDGKLVHNGTWYAMDVTTKDFGYTEGNKWSNGRNNLAGEWFYLDAKKHKIDIVIGEQPGGEYFNALGIEMKDSGYGSQIFTTRPLTDDARTAVQNAYEPIRPDWDSPYVFHLEEADD